MGMLHSTAGVRARFSPAHHSSGVTSHPGRFLVKNCDDENSCAKLNIASSSEIPTNICVLCEFPVAKPNTDTCKRCFERLLESKKTHHAIVSVRCIADCLPDATDKCSQATKSLSDLPLDKLGVSFETLRALLLRESAVRLGPEIQVQYLVENYFPVTEAAQRSVAQEFATSPEFGNEIIACARALGFNKEQDGSELIKAGVTLMQCAEDLVRTDVDKLREVREISFYRKYNRCINGSLKPNDNAPLLISNDACGAYQLHRPLYRLQFNSEITSRVHSAGTYQIADMSMEQSFLSDMKSLDPLFGDNSTCWPVCGTHNPPLILVGGSYS